MNFELSSPFSPTGDQPEAIAALSDGIKSGVPFQTFTNRSDMLGGSTLGNISNTKVALNAVDIGLPQLAMHSPYETAGVKDTYYLIQAAEKFFK